MLHMVLVGVCWVLFASGVFSVCLGFFWLFFLCVFDFGLVSFFYFLKNKNPLSDVLASFWQGKVSGLLNDVHTEN